MSDYEEATHYIQMTESHVTSRLIKGERDSALRDVIATGSSFMMSHVLLLLSFAALFQTPVERSHRFLSSQVGCHVVKAIVCDARLLPVIVSGSKRMAALDAVSCSLAPGSRSLALSKASPKLTLNQKETASRVYSLRCAPFEPCPLSCSPS